MVTDKMGPNDERKFFNGDGTRGGQKMIQALRGSEQITR
jgi:hypothetical protein